MNNIEAINQFWTKDAECRFTDKETALYFYLVNVCNTGKCRNPFSLSNHATLAKFHWGKASFERARGRLKEAGLIDFRHGLGRGNMSQYIIKDVNRNSDTGENCVQPSLFGLPEKDAGKDTQPVPFSEKASEKGTQKDTFSEQKGISTDPFSIRFFGKGYEKGTQTDTFCECFDVPKPLKTEVFASEISQNKNQNRQHISISNTINNNSLDNRIKNKDHTSIDFSKKEKSENQNLVHGADEKKEKISAQKEKEVLDLFGSICGSFPKIMQMTRKRKDKILLRLSEMGGMKNLENVFKKMEASDFLKGNNKYGWIASFDWVFKNSENWVKVIEGNYDNRVAQPQIIKPANDARFMGMLQTDLSKW
jgi:hypothetical protein